MPPAIDRHPRPRHGGEIHPDRVVCSVVAHLSSFTSMKSIKRTLQICFAYTMHASRDGHIPEPTADGPLLKTTRAQRRSVSLAT